jgi:hypothetical protein
MVMAETIQDSDEAQKKIASPPIPAGGENTVGDTFCPICGREATDPSLKRFGEYFCSEAHVAEYAREVRSKQATETTAIATVAGADVTTSQTTGTLEPGQAPQKKGGISSRLKMAACCGGMLLLLPALGLVNLGGVAAVGGSLLSLVAVLACPIGMYLMMRMMMKQEKHAGHGPDADTLQKELPPKGTGPSA